jgi:transposase
MRGIKLSSVASDILGVSGRQILAALVGGTSDAAVLAELARGRLRPKVAACVRRCAVIFVSITRSYLGNC